MCKERRKSESMALRELVSALKKLINARDALWSLGFFDRLFRFNKCRDVFNEYDDAVRAVRDAVAHVMESAGSSGKQAGCVKEQSKTGDNTGEAPEEPPGVPQQNPAAISMEEFEVLLGKPKFPR